MKRALLLLLLAASTVGQTRIASDFEIAQMEKQLARARDFSSQVSARLNLGDLRTTRRELSLARAEYEAALRAAEKERLAARRASRMTSYAEATSYAALAQAKLGRDGEAFVLLEEATRYTSGDAQTWNLYATAMNLLGKPRKAVSAARNAVQIAGEAAPLDRAVYRYTLANALLAAGETDDARRELTTLTDALRSDTFERLREQVAREEAFEIYSSARGDAAAYVSLLNRAQLRLGALYEQLGDHARARVQFERVIAARSDDATALAALARLATTDEERERRYAEAFEANPFAASLAREYRQHVAEHAPGNIDESTTGGRMRRALVQLERGDRRAARTSLDALIAKYPANEMLQALRREAEATTAFAMPSASPTAAELRRVLESFESMAPEERVALDAATFTSVARFDVPMTSAAPGQTVLASGTIDGVPFRFSEPTVFDGAFDVTQPLRLTYRILGATRADDTEVLLLEPVRVVP